ncbi:DEAD/DEAH box helicase [Paenibacillaceae bacterium WGS1546]|uniref:DEAD/DEAH box helicase n=1 Tax=Cohnella sp. WGS1546 TaxID=3366810 RepID=UPI00372D64D1
MRQAGPWIVEASRETDGGCFISCTAEQLANGALQQLRSDLFAWHKESFYGTMLEEKIIGDRSGYVLSPFESMTYWADPGLLLHGRGAQWDSGYSERVEEAALLKTALAKGWFLPGIRRDGLTGGVAAGWRMLRETENHPDKTFALRCAALGWERLDERLNEVLTELISVSDEIREAWLAVTAAAPLADALAMRAALDDRLDEEEFWDRIGYRTDTAPFMIGLRLEEPEEDGEAWRLRPMAVDRSNPAQMIAYEWDGRPRQGAVPPAAWSAVGVASAIRRKEERWRSWNEDLQWDMDDRQALTFLEQTSERLIAQGIRVYMPGWWEELRKQRPAIVSKVRRHAGASGLLGMKQLVEFDWRIALGGADVDVPMFKEAVKSGRSLMRVEGRWILLHPRWVKTIERTIRRMSNRETLTLSEIIEMVLSGGRELPIEDGDSALGAEEEGAASSAIRWEVQLNSHLKSFLLQLEERSAESYVPPVRLGETLRGYQTKGAGWLSFMRGIGFGACLADDMGLGKTIQLVAYLAGLKERDQLNEPALVICPTSVLGNWQKEIERFAPELSVYLHYGTKRAAAEDLKRTVSGCDVVLTSYSLAHLDEAGFKEMNWSVIALDEAQNIKNPHGKQSLAIRGLHAEHRIALTGTPVENRLSELWTIFDFVNPGYLGSLTSFHRRFGMLDKPSNEAERHVRAERTEQLQRLIRPFLMRRLKNDPNIQLDLPEKNENLVYVPLTVEQGSLYELELERMLEQIDRLDPMERRGLILATLGKLKQICNHPALYLKEHGQTSRSESGRSHKLQRLLEMAGEVLEEGGQGIVFTQFIEMGKLLQAELEREYGGTVEFLHGGVNKNQRDRMIERFQNEDPGGRYRFLVLSIKAGGTGLNLTAANHVFHYDRWWNPAVEDQATDRAYRIGQSRDVQVHKFVALGTLEERIDEMIVRKKQFSSQIVGSGESWITELTTDELKEMFSLRREWVRD